MIMGILKIAQALGPDRAQVMVANSVFGVEALDFEDLVEVHRTHNAITVTRPSLGPRVRTQAR